MDRPLRHGTLLLVTGIRKITARAPFFRARLVIVALALAAPIPGEAGIGHLPDLGHASAVVMSRAKQRAFGKAFLRHARKTLRFVDDPAATSTVRRLGRRLVAASPDPQIRFHFYIVESPVVNAFSVPGGYVFINTGAILAARDEDELAAVMAHEISHDTQRHIPRLIAFSKRLSWAELAGMLAGLALMGSSQFEGGAAAMSLSSAGLAAETLKHRRGYESEADHIGLRTMARAGFNPRAMAAFFQRLKTDDRFMTVDIPESWRTHPATDIRIAEAENLAARYPNTPIRDRPSFDRLQAALIADEAPAHDARARITQQLRGRKDTSAFDYGRALVDLRLGRLQAARGRLARLARAHPRVVAYRLGLADAARAAGRYRRAVTAFRAAWALRPQSIALAVSYTQALLAASEDRRALREARHLVARHPYRGSLYRLLAQAYGFAHNYLEAHEALAEARYRQGDAAAARRQLRLARPFATTAGERARLKTFTTAIHEGWRAPPTFP